MNAIANLIRRAAAIFRLRCLETTLQGQNDALHSIRDQATRERIILARAATRRRLDRTTSAYIELKRLARRRTWRAA